MTRTLDPGASGEPSRDAGQKQRQNLKGWGAGERLGRWSAVWLGFQRLALAAQGQMTSRESGLKYKPTVPIRQQNSLRTGRTVVGKTHRTERNGLRGGGWTQGPQDRRRR